MNLDPNKQAASSEGSPSSEPSSSPPASSSAENSATWRHQKVKPSSEATPVLPEEAKEVSKHSLSRRSSSSSGDSIYLTPPSSPEQDIVFRAVEPAGAFHLLMELIENLKGKLDPEKVQHCLRQGFIEDVDQGGTVGSGRDEMPEAVRQKLAIKTPYIPEGEPSLSQWLSANHQNCFPALCFGLSACLQDSQGLRDWGKLCIQRSLEIHGDLAIVQINCWLALHRLQQGALHRQESELVVLAFEEASLRGIPIADWMMALASFRLLPGLTLSPRQGLSYLLSCSARMNPAFVTGEVTGQVLPFMQDPVSFSSMEKLVKGYEAGLSDKREQLIESIKNLHDPRVLEELLPWCIKRAVKINGARETFSKVLGYTDYSQPAIKAVRPIVLILEQLSKVKLQYVIVENRERKKMVELEQKRNKLSDSREIQLFEKQMEEERVGIEERMSDFKAVLDEKMMKSVKQSLKLLDQALKMDAPDTYKALIHAFYGMSYELGMTPTGKNLLRAAGHYMEAAKLGKFRELAHYAYIVYDNYEIYEKAAIVADLLSDSAPIERDAQFYKEKAVLFRKKVAEAEPSEEVPAIDMAEKMLVKLRAGGSADIDPQWLPASKEYQPKKAEANGNGSKKKRKRVRRQKGHEVPVDASSQINGAGELLPEKTTVIASAVSTSAASSLSPASQDDAPSNDTAPLHLLPEYWLPAIHDLKNIALSYRAEGLFDQGEAILRDALERYKDAPGIERLHEEYAWFLIRRRREPVMLLAGRSLSRSNPEKQMTGLSKSLLDQSQYHLRCALAKKLQVDVSSLPEAEHNFKEYDEIADRIAKTFPRKRDRETYLKGYTVIVSSLGHRHGDLAEVSSRQGAQAQEKKSHTAYGFKRH